MSQIPTIFYLLLLFTPAHPHLCAGEWDCTGNFMTCRDNHCVCDEEEEKLVEPLLPPLSLLPVPNLCRGVALVGQYCDNLTHICTSNSFCNPEERLCQCNSGFEEYSPASECRLGWGHPCDDHSKLCNPQKFLSCSENSTCSCGGHGLTYDLDEESCVAAVGGQCELRPWLGLQLSCGRGVTCVIEEGGDYHYGVCECESGLYSQGGHQCVPIFGKVCTHTDADEDCGGHEDYSCQGTDVNIIMPKVCQCRSGLVYVSHNSTGCKLAVGQNCSKSSSDRDCVSYAYCSAEYSGHDLTCQCLEDYFPTSDGRCQLGHGASNCSNSNPCHQESGLVCLPDFSCGCAEGFLYNQRKCLGIHGTKCDHSKDCVQNAECDIRCHCRDTFVLGADGSCSHGFGSPCDLFGTDQCLPSLGMECQSFSSNSSSKSSSGTCTCIRNSGTIYDVTSRKCLLKVGESCDYLNPSLRERRCIQRAFCGMRDQCQCYHGYSTTPEGDCLVSYGFLCDEDETDATKVLKCNPFQGLICLQNKCQCDLGQVYNETRGKCEFEVKNISNSSKPSESQYYSVSAEGSYSSTAMPIQSGTSHYWLVAFGVLGLFLICGWVVYSVRKGVK